MLKLNMIQGATFSPSPRFGKFKDEFSDLEKYLVKYVKENNFISNISLMTSYFGNVSQPVIIYLTPVFNTLPL